MRRLLLVFFVLCSGPLKAQPTVGSQANGLIIFQNGDTLRGQVRVDVPVNRVYADGLPGGERIFTANDVKYVELERPRAFRQPTDWAAPVPLAELIGMARTATYISADCNGKPMLFEVIETGARVVLLHHSHATIPRSALWLTDPWTALLRKEWFDPPAVGFYLGDLTTNRVRPFRCSLSGLLRVLPYYHAEVKRFAWQHPTATVRTVVNYYNSLKAHSYYEPSAGLQPRTKNR